MQWWVSNILTREFPGATISPWKVSNNGSFVSPYFQARNPEDTPAMFEFLQSISGVNQAELLRGKVVILTLNEEGINISLQQTFSLPKDVHAGMIDSSTNINDLTAQYLAYRHSDTEEQRDAHIFSYTGNLTPYREDVSNPLYKMWYAYSYAQRYLKYNCDLKVVNGEMLDYSSTVGTGAGYDLVATLAIFPQILSAPRNYQCHFCEQLSSLVLRFLSQTSKPTAVDKHIAQVSSHALECFLSSIKLFPSALI